MDKISPFVEFANGDKTPRLGLGTARATSEAEADQIAAAVIEHGYRHIDTASRYRNETIIGNALKTVFESGIPRGEMFIVTKVWISEMDDPVKSLRESLDRLKLDYVDLFLIHWPLSVKVVNDKYVKNPVPISKTWQEMEKCVHLGLARNIGVSNFKFQLLQDLLSYCEIRPVCNQIEIHPLNNRRAFVQWMLSEQIQTIAYSPLGFCSAITNEEDIILKNPEILSISEHYGKTPAQIILNWGLSNGHVVIPKSVTSTRLKENFESQNFAISQSDIDRIDRLNKNLRLYPDLIKTSFSDAFPVLD
jgi:diketogulonate reductase-like aldo/keto reductase